MRLIDADALNREIDKAECYSRDPYVTYMSECITNAPTVDAIPIEWMREWRDSPVSEESMDRCDTSKGDLIEWMILEWAERKEE